MKTIYFLLLVGFTTFANSMVKEDVTIINPNAKIKHEDTTAIKLTSTSNYISGLKIVTCESPKYGRHIYITSDFYVKKKVTFYNNMGKKVYSTSTVGSPIYLSKIENGLYKVKITEGKKTEIKDLVVN